MEWESIMPCLKHDKNSPPTYAQAPRQTNVELYERETQVPPAIAKLLNPIIHREAIPADPSKTQMSLKLEPASTQNDSVPPATTRVQEEWKPDTTQTSYGHQVALANQINWKSDAVVHNDDPGSLEVGIKQETDIKKEKQDDQLLPPLYTMVNSMHIASGLQDNYIDSAPKYKRPNSKRPKIKWTTQEEILLKQGLDEGLGWQAIAKKYLPTRDRSGCYLHWQAMQAKALPLRRGWRQDESERLAKAMKGRSKEMKALWLKIAKDMGKGRTWREVEIQQAFLIAKKDKSKLKPKAKL